MSMENLENRERGPEEIAKNLVRKILQKGGIRLKRLDNLIDAVESPDEKRRLWDLKLQVAAELGMTDDSLQEIEEDEQKLFEALGIVVGGEDEQEKSTVKIKSKKPSGSSINIRSRKKSEE